MRGRDGSDDGQPEPVSVPVVCPAPIEPLEGLEEAVHFPGRYGWSGVGHRQDGPAVLYPGPDLDPAAGHVVADGVGEQVGYEPFDEQGVAIEGRRFAHLAYVDPESVGLGPETGKGRRDGGGEVNGFVSVQPAFAAGQGEQGLDQARLLIAGGEHLLGGATPVGGRRAGVVERHLEEGALGSQRRAQLVGGVGDEVPLGLEGGFEPREEAVEGVPEFLELVLRAVEGQALVQAGGGDPPGRAGDGPDGSQHPAGHQPAGQEGECGHDGQGDSRVDQKLVRVGRALRGLDGPCLGQLMDGLGQLVRGLGQLMDGLGQPVLVLSQLLVLCRNRPPGKSRQLILGLCQLILEQVELLGQGLGQRGRKLEIPDSGSVRDLR